MSHDNRANSVTIDDSDGHDGFAGKVDFCRVHMFNTRQLLLQQYAESLAGLVDFLHYNPPSLV